MTDRPLACVVLAAGKGTRMRTDLPKVLHRVAGRPMIGHVVAAAEALRPERVVVVVGGVGMEAVAQAVAPHRTEVQSGARGTADALKAALPALDDFAGDVLVLYGDTPLVTSATLRQVIDGRRGPSAPAVVVLGMRPKDPGRYGRVVRGPDGGLAAIVEFLDATPEERAIGLCNGGIMAFDGARLSELLEPIGNDNAKGEFYLTDAVGVARAAGHACAVVEGDAQEVLGVNGRGELAIVEGLMQERLRQAAMANGATLVDPATVYFSFDTKLGRDVVVGPNVVFGLDVVVGDRVEIKPFCHFERVRIGDGAEIGPFARLRPGAEIGAGAHIGNFVEIKNATVASGAKINHLSYIGDASVGAKANIGAGTITCNYDGYGKYRTEIGDGAFVGSNSSLIAPVTIGAGAYVSAGSVVTADVPADALVVARARPQLYQGWAKRFRARKAAQRAERIKAGD